METWTDHAKCKGRDPDDFVAPADFQGDTNTYYRKRGVLTWTIETNPETGVRSRVNKTFCDDCMVKAECLEATEHNDRAFRGGMTRRQRHIQLDLRRNQRD